VANSAERIKAAEAKLLQALDHFTGDIEERTLEELVDKVANTLRHVTECGSAQLAGTSAALDGAPESICPYPENGADVAGYRFIWLGSYHCQKAEVDVRRFAVQAVEMLGAVERYLAAMAYHHPHLRSDALQGRASALLAQAENLGLLKEEVDNA